MKSWVPIITASLCLSAVGAWGEWDTPRDFPHHSVEERSIERRTPGWRTRARYADAETELAEAERLREAGRWRAAGRRYRAVVANWHESPAAVTAQQRLAEMLEQRQRHEQAFYEYQYLIDHYIGRFPFLAVLERQYDLAMQAAERASDGFFGWRSVDGPLAMLEKVLDNAPRWERAPSVKARIGKLQEEDGAYELALNTYSRLQQRYPGTPEAAAAAFREVRAMIRLSRRHPHDEALATEALARLRNYRARVPEAERERVEPYVEEIEKRVIGFWRERANLYDHIQNRPRAALIVYEEWLSRFPDMEDADQIRERIETLRTKVDR